MKDLIYNSSKIFRYVFQKLYNLLKQIEDTWLTLLIMQMEDTKNLIDKGEKNEC